MSSSKPLRVVGVIPARFGSTRFPGKPLVPIAGKPLLQWVIEGARTSKILSSICVATDDDRIRALAESCGAECVMTDSELPTGTDRVWAAAKNLDCDVVVNIQGDEPLISGQLLDRLAQPFLDDTELEMATIGRALDEDGVKSMNTVKIVLNRRDEAIYFSRFAIPYSRQSQDPGGTGWQSALQHLGIYAYRKTFLQQFCEQPPTALEEREGLEQLRALYLGARIRVVKTEDQAWGVDAPEDVAKLEKMIRSRGSR